MKRCCLPLVLSLFVLVSALPLQAGRPVGDREVVVGKDAPPPADDQNGEANPIPPDAMGQPGIAPPAITDNFLGQTYKLTFQLLPHDDKDKSWSVVTANPKYAIHMTMKQQATEYQVTVDGEAGVLDDKPDALLLGFHVDLQFTTPDGHLKLEASGSRLVSFGKATILAELGDKTLQVVVTKVE